jgi:hypothetical protein
MNLLQKILTALAAGSACILGAQAQIVPYLQSPTPNSIYVNWITDTGTNSTVQFGTDPSNLVQIATGSMNYENGSVEQYYYHTVQLTNLTADTWYHYKVVTDGQESDVHRFRSAPEQNSSSGTYRILVIGDHQVRYADGSPRTLPLVEAAKAKIESLYGMPFEESINIVLNDGDQVDVPTPDQYRNIHFKVCEPYSANVPTMTTVGNHERYNPDSSLVRYGRMFEYTDYDYQGISTGTDNHYAHQQANILFVHTNSEQIDSAQTQWVNDISAAAATDDNIDWVISLVHRPYQAEQYIGDISSWFRNTAMPMLSATGKHALNIGGHHHNYHRGQTRDWPTYHIISGGAAWDQWWGQSNEQDYDDVTKTICNWAWQIIEIDLDNRVMTVDSYAEGNPRFNPTNSSKGDGYVYSSRLIDSFERRLGEPAPEKPSITNNLSAPVELPVTLVSSDFSTTSATQQFYSTQFQVATSPDFNSANLAIDHIRDLENLYGDTGNPDSTLDIGIDYEPVDIHASVNILEYSIPAVGTPNGTYFARVRHRDNNAEWSSWSDSVTFEVIGSVSADAELILAKNFLAPGEDLQISYAGGTGKTNDWVAIYPSGQTPGIAAPTASMPVNTGNPIAGSLIFTNDFPANIEYYAVFLYNGGFEEMGDRESFYVGQQVELAVPASTTILNSGYEISFPQYDQGSNVSLTYSNAPGSAGGDWIGVYRMGHTPGPVGSTQWTWINTTNGVYNISGLGNGFYFTTFFVNGAYTEVSERAYFAIGHPPGTLTMPSSVVLEGQPFTVNFSNGSGIPKDYLGVFDKGAIELGSTGNELFSYMYVGGASGGSFSYNFNDAVGEIPSGEYFVALFQNDSYDEITDRAYFSVVSPFSEEGLVMGTSTNSSEVGISWQAEPGLRYSIYSRTNLTEGSWVLVDTLDATTNASIVWAESPLGVSDGGFDSTAPWLNNGGSIRGGSQGGYGWSSSYFTGDYPTDDTFATTFEGPVRQDLTNTFVAGQTYRLEADFFSSDTYGSSAGASIEWTLALTADGSAVALDSWYSDEFSGSVPAEKIVNVFSGSPGLTHAALEYTATAADSGKVIGIQLGGDSDALMQAGDDYFGMMDNIELSVISATAEEDPNLIVDDMLEFVPVTTNKESFYKVEAAVAP